VNAQEKFSLQTDLQINVQNRDEPPSRDGSGNGNDFSVAHALPNQTSGLHLSTIGNATMVSCCTNFGIPDNVPFASIRRK
jgi:hypothetical protein